MQDEAEEDDHRNFIFRVQETAAGQNRAIFLDNKENATDHEDDNWLCAKKQRVDTYDTAHLGVLTGPFCTSHRAEAFGVLLAFRAPYPVHVALDEELRLPLELVVR